MCSRIKTTKKLVYGNGKNTSCLALAPKITTSPFTVSNSVLCDLHIYGCACMLSAGIALVYVMLLSTSQGEPCVVSRRLPSFGLGVRRTAEHEMPRATEFASRKRGGACHMARLPRIPNTMDADPVQGAVYSVQSCTHTNTTITCTMLAQNSSFPGGSKVLMHDFLIKKPPARGMSLRTPHRHRTLSGSCVRANVTRVLIRLLKTMPVNASSKRQLSFGEAHCLSTECYCRTPAPHSLWGQQYVCKATHSVVMYRLSPSRTLLCLLCWLTQMWRAQLCRQRTISGTVIGCSVHTPRQVFHKILLECALALCPKVCGLTPSNE